MQIIEKDNDFKITVQAILLSDNKILLMKRLNTGFKDGFYGLPGGKLEPKEYACQGILRELKEELSLNIFEKEIMLSSVIHFNYVGYLGRIIYLNFLADVSGKKYKNNEEHKCSEIIWSEIDNLPLNTITATKLAIKNYQNNLNYSICSENL